MNKLIDALNSGKRRGYEETRLVERISFLFQYAIKKQNNIYYTYYFSTSESRMDLLEDDENEEIKEFSTLDAALDHLKNKGAELEKFTAIKKSLPF
ncbi:hypothetical protein C1Y08_04265 [Pseudomonas sp. FW306-02-F02-AA]|uniref:Uncharacterized protein n=1 Tax=Pseudomonas fluorescens TaxID=294 RepID=A0A0N9WEP9_PSEFL|nr:MULTISPECIES: hypothetical protein [Pseudomonas]ALI01347.1 hypothetical protein AO353_09805 [Pseudomonas fluorescens]PMZ05941.1 hypothetical protein C1Y07_02850 [Pseudomonas sp. FW306-02-F02-AB]PMZ11511.1 hypothetical protein C1Y06_04580 [Pseudomonas sp. FW306-02-H06C]PMZ17434.1 hypothetical protein C1Y08_04265 [Pseudomonas sp. FW306-02-F02-AA]PMZ23151.1 hypothetical protein C1Y09_05925 [Pseudomonas sp. FW306-02-F08-AA]